MINKALLVAIILAITLPLQIYCKADNQPQTTQPIVQEAKVATTQTTEEGFFTDAYIKGTKVETVTGIEATELRQICNKEEILISETLKNKDGYLEASPNVQGNLIQLIKNNDKIYPEATVANYLLQKYENAGQYFFAVDFIDNKTIDYHVVLLENSVANLQVKIFNGFQQTASNTMIFLLNNEDSKKFIYKRIEVTMSDDGKFTVSKDTPSLFSKIVTKRLKINNKQDSQKSNSKGTDITHKNVLEITKEYAKNITSYRYRRYVIFNK